MWGVCPVLGKGPTLDKPTLLFRICHFFTCIQSSTHRQKWVCCTRIDTQCQILKHLCTKQVEPLTLIRLYSPITWRCISLLCAYMIEYTLPSSSNLRPVATAYYTSYVYSIGTQHYSHLYNYYTHIRALRVSMYMCACINIQ